MPGDTDSRKTEGVCYIPSGEPLRTAVYARVTGDTYESDLDLTVGRLVHEFGHSVGLGHCALATCAMAPVVQPEHLIRAVVGTADAFCDQHAEELEAAGWAQRRTRS
jgi:predicted Zn-dependent protease